MCESTAPQSASVPADGEGAVEHVRRFLERALCRQHGDGRCSTAICLGEELARTALQVGAPPITVGSSCDGTAAGLQVRVSWRPGAGGPMTVPLSGAAGRDPRATWGERQVDGRTQVWFTV